MTQIAQVSPAVRSNFLGELLRPDAASEAPKEVPLLPAPQPHGPWAILQDRLSKVAPKKKRGWPKASRNRTEVELLAEGEMKGMGVDEVTASEHPHMSLLIAACRTHATAPLPFASTSGKHETRPSRMLTTKKSSCTNMNVKIWLSMRWTSWLMTCAISSSMTCGINVR